MAMPRRVQDAFLRAKMPDGLLEFDSTVPDGRHHRAMRQAIGQGFRSATIEINGTVVLARDFLSVLGGCALILTHAPRKNLAPDVSRFITEARPRLERCWKERFTDVTKSLFEGVHAPLLAHSRIDTRLLSARVERTTMRNGKIQPRVIVSATEPQVRTARLDRGARPLYRVPKEMGCGGIEWLSWHDAELGLEDRGREYPVFVQSHALRQLQKRMNFAPAAPYLEAWLSDALSSPRIVERDGRDLLVEQRLKEHRVGYLIVTPLPEMVVVRTFLFLTMEGTPEARLLKRRLRLTRRDVDWLGLSELSAFTQTDLRSDPVVRPLLEKCGCGHLFELDDGTAVDGYAPQPRAHAAEVRRYLRIAA